MTHEFFQILLSTQNGSTPRCEKVIEQNEPPVPVCILRDPAYPLLSFLLKEFANGGKNICGIF